MIECEEGSHSYAYKLK